MSEFKRPRHALVTQALETLDREFLSAAKCYFGGGTRIAMALGEYRESADIDFLCADRDGYRALRSTVTAKSLGAIMRGKIPLAREVIADHRPEAGPWIKSWGGWAVAHPPTREADVPMYLVEVYVPRSRADEARATGIRAREAAEELASENASIRYVRTTFLPDDETCLHLFEASSAEVVEEATSRAELGRVRVVSAIDASGPHDDHDED